MRGCDNCSALMLNDDVFCPTCGAGVQEAETAGGKVRIPVRRHGVIPPMPKHAWAPEGGGESHVVRGAVVGLLVSAAAAGATAAAIYQFW